jgi:hypothetical protein
MGCPGLSGELADVRLAIMNARGNQETFNTLA